jgi:hypothetical protein
MHTTTLHLQLNSMAHHYIRTVEEHLRKVFISHQRGWDSILLIILLAYRASTHDTMGLTPASLVLRREFQLPCHLLFWAPPTRNEPQLIMWPI